VSLRHLTPAYSPVSLRSLQAGARAAAGFPSPGDGLAEQLGTRLGARRVVLLDSCTAALRTAIATCQAAKPGAPVGLPAWACYDVVSAAMGAAAPMAFYDLDPTTLLPAPGSLTALAALKPACVVVVHAYGVPVDVSAVRQAVGGDVPIVEDAAQGWGGARDGQGLGSSGDFSTFSFGRGKGITGGRGGALVVLSERGQALARDIEAGSANAGWRDIEVAGALWTLGRPELYGIPSAMPWLHLGETVYRPPRPVGAMSRAARAMVAASLADADAEATHRRETAAKLRAIVASLALVSNVSVTSGVTPSWLRLPIILQDAATAARLLAEGRSLGIAGPYPRDLPAVAQEVRGNVMHAGSVSGARALASRLVTLPTHSQVVLDDLLRLEALLVRLLGRRPVSATAVPA